MRIVQKHCNKSGNIGVAARADAVLAKASGAKKRTSARQENGVGSVGTFVVAAARSVVDRNARLLVVQRTKEGVFIDRVANKANVFVAQSVTKKAFGS